MQLTLTPLADAGVSLLPFDIVWDGTRGISRSRAEATTAPPAGFVSANPLGTAALLLLFTDGRADDQALRFEHRGDRRGWPGDGFDVDEAAGEAPLGSLLWRSAAPRSSTSPPGDRGRGAPRPPPAHPAGRLRHHHDRGLRRQSGRPRRPIHRPLRPRMARRSTPRGSMFSGGAPMAGYSVRSLKDLSQAARKYFSSRSTGRRRASGRTPSQSPPRCSP